MELVNITLDKPIKSNGLILALGYFDGLHLGHQQLLKRVLQEKGELQPALLSLSISPKVLFNKRSNKVLTSVNDKLALDYDLTLYLLHFDLQSCQLSAEAFIDYLLKSNVKAIVCGPNYRFGAKAKGDSALISSYSKGAIKVYVEPFFYVDDEIVSTTLIINYLNQGNIAKVNQLLGRQYQINAESTGTSYFSKEYLLPSSGIYDVLIANKKYPARIVGDLIYIDQLKEKAVTIIFC